MALRMTPLPSIASFVPRRHIVALAAKRSPKRLKYSTPRFTKEGELVSIEVDPCGADAWKLQPIIHLLKQGAVGVIPTDTLYAIACDCKNHSAVERLRRIKKIDSSKPLSILCRSFRDIDTFTTAIGDIYGPEGLDFVVDGGVRVAEPSTIVDMTGPYPKVIREGKGPILPWMVVEDDESHLRQDLIASGT